MPMNEKQLMTLTKAELVERLLSAEAELETTQTEPIVGLRRMCYPGRVPVIVDYVTEDKFNEYNKAIQEEGLSDCIDKMYNDKLKGTTLDSMVRNLNIERFYDFEEVDEELREAGIEVEMDEDVVDGVPNWKREIVCEYYKLLNRQNVDEDDDATVDDMYYKNDILYVTLK